MTFSDSHLHYLILSAMIALAPSVNAEYSVTGRIVDSNNMECANAIYHIYAETDTLRPVVNAITDLDGIFNQAIINPGNYIFQAEYVGLQTISYPFNVSDAHPAVNLGTIVMKPLDTVLEEVVVRARRPVIVSDGANLEYNVQEDPTSATMTILEMLRKVPMVTVDGEDNIRVNGSTDFRIYLNGKPNPMFDSEPQRILKAMPATAIARIEVLTEPGAKYDAEGAGGILNIITEVGGQQEMANGYAGTIGLQAGIDNLAANGFLRGKYRYVSGSASVTYAHGPLFNRSSHNSTQTEYLDNYDDHLLISRMREDKSNPFDFVQGNVSLSWEPNVNNLFAINATINDVSGGQDMEGTNEMFDIDGNTRWSYERKMKADLSRFSTTIDASYQHLFRGQDHSLTTSFQLAHVNQKLDLHTTENNITSYDVMDTRNNEYTLQIDWHNRLNEHNTVEAGVKGILTDNRNDSHTTVESTTTEGIMLKQYRNLGAIYADYAGTYGKLSASAGVRYEYSNLGVKFLTEGRENFDSYLNDIVPNASLSWSFTPMTTLRLAYNMRISRPDISQLNPYQFSMMANMVIMGNPELSSQRSNNISLSFSSFTGKVQMNFKAEYQNINNLISDYYYTDSDILYQTYHNSGTQQKGIFSANVNYFVTPQILLAVNGGVQYTDYSVHNPDLHRYGWSGNAGGNFSWTLPCKVSLSAYGGWSSSSPTLQGKRSGWSYYGLGVSRSFMPNDALKLSLNASNMFSKWWHWNNEITTSSSITHTQYARQNWNVSIGLQWNFGHLKQNIRRVENRIDNNDKVDTGSNTGSNTGGVM